MDLTSTSVNQDRNSFFRLKNNAKYLYACYICVMQSAKSVCYHPYIEH